MMGKINRALFLVPVPLVLALFSGCEDSGLAKKTTAADGGVSDANTTMVPGVCELAKCPQPKTGIACCTPDAECGNDPTGIGLGCLPNAVADRVCKIDDCPDSPLGKKCCTPLAECGYDPFNNGIFCFGNVPPTDAPAPPVCDVTKCTTPDGGPKPCCQLNGQCGWDSLGIGLCFPPPQPLCDLSKCPPSEAGPKACCQANGQCGLDVLGIGLCFAPAPPPTCDLAACPTPDNGIKKCCLPNGTCGWDSLNIGICFPPPPAIPDAGQPPPVSTTPPDDPSIDPKCPSFIGLFGPQWGCCSDYGVCGTFLNGQCGLGVGAQIPNGPPPAADSGVSEPFLRCTPPPKADGAAH